MAKTDKLDIGDLQEDFGSVGGVGLVLSNPELLVLAYKSQGWTNAKIGKNGKVIPGKKEEGVEWDDSKIAAELTNTTWYQENDGNLRVADNAKNTDPATWGTNVEQIKSSLQRKAVERGASLEGQDLDALAEEILRTNYSYISRTPDAQIPDSVLDSYLTPLVALGPGGELKGSAGLNASQLRQYAEQYGVAMTDKWYLEQVQALENGETTEFDVKNIIVNNARETWPTLGDQITEYRSVYNIADSYIQRMAATLEMDPDTINLDTPEIKNALVAVGPDGNPIRKTMWEFEQGLRKDPRWDTTKQGQKELSDASMQMLKDFGFWK